MTLPISEIFYSLQGEGIRTGKPSIFIRIQGCKAKNACYAMGIRCDTEFNSGRDMTLDELYNEIKEHPCKEIVWTGGEPADRITDEVATFFKERGYYQCIETSGLFSVCEAIDFVSVSPKVAEHVVKRNFTRVNELRYVRHSGQEIPEPEIEADYYFLSPHFDGTTLNETNLRHCVTLCLENPKWQLSVQDHKLWSVL